MIIMQRKKCLLAAALTAAAILSGCRNTDAPEFSYESNFFADYDRIDDQSSSDVSEDPETPEIPEEPKIEDLSMVVLDPINERRITCDGRTITLSGAVGDDFTPTVSVPHSETYEEKDGKFVYTAVIKNVKGYFDLRIFKNGVIRLYAENGNTSVVRMTDVEETNQKAVENAIDQPLDQVAEYISMDTSRENIDYILGRITEISNTICEGITSDYDKLRAISRWVSANIYYDYVAFDKGVPAETLTLEYMLENSSSVCGGYSNMTSALAAVQGIKVYNVHGSAVTNSRTFAEADGEYHEWNYAIIDGRVIWIDSGWNSYCYRNRDGSYSKGNIGFKYFDISPAALAQNHKAKYAEYRDYFAVNSALS